MRAKYISALADRLEQQSLHARIAELENTIRAMLKADDDYGMGFYNEPSWLVHYRRLRELVGMPARSL